MGELKISEEVQSLIEEKMLEGKTPTEIAKILNETGIPTALGKATWNNSTVGRICKHLNQPIMDYEDPAEDRAGAKVSLRCRCGTGISRITDMFHHTWERHHRMPTRDERTPV